LALETWIPMSDDASSLHTHRSLLVRVRDPKDGESWKLFVELYTPPVMRYCRLRGLQDADVADVAQDVMAQVARSMHTFNYNPERGRFRDWLGTITRRRVNRFLMNEKIGTAGTGGEEMANAIANLAAIEADAEWTIEFNAQILHTALDRIRPFFGAITWQAFACVWLDNQTAAETATRLNLTLRAVYVAKSKVLRRLEQEVMELAEDIPMASPK
jgi:RNA polymerase sigma factor (sigma-70 family)